MTAVSIMTGIYLIQLAILLWVTYSKKFFKAYTAAKTAVSCGFMMLAATSWLSGGMPHLSFFAALIPCLLFCLSGDVFLALANSKGKFFSPYFLKGVLCFMIAHVGFCVLYSTMAPFKWHNIIVPILLAGFTFICSYSKRFQLKRMRCPATLYAFMVGLMCIKSFDVCMALQMSTRGLLLAVGSGLFLLSDGIILFLYFYVKKRAWLHGANLFTYYIGVMCIALSCAFV
ncbi:MAG: lysoplasmalogenase [Oscillospiraceae bacterium]|nr:lysoplasmalogenase [Oscillospiraceae bacterium]